MRVKKGDEVVVRTGKWAGQRGEVIRAIPTKNQVVLEGHQYFEASREAARTDGTSRHH